MKIQYYVNNCLRDTSVSNQDIDVLTEINDTHVLVKIKAKTDIVLKNASESMDYSINKGDTFYTNGYQSWTTTYESKISKKEKKCPKFFNKFDFLTVRPYGDYEYYETKNDRLHSYDYFYVKGENEIFVINNNFRNAYLIIELLKRKNVLNFYSDIDGKELKEGNSFIVFDFELYPSYKFGLEVFNKKFPKRDIPKIFGYTSWYNYYQDINEEIILRDLEALDDKFDLFQIDDGYETYVGDWMDVDKAKFPNGLADIVKRIHGKGMKAGLWLAPFVAERESNLFKQHPDWIKKDKNGVPMKAGVNWSGQFALDLDKVEVRNYIKKCLKYYVDLGFDFFKLDFIYSSALIHDGITKAESTEKSYKFLKECLEGKIILGCGALLNNVYGNFDYVRVGPDVSLDFDDKLYMRLFHRERPSTKHTILNTIYRSFMNDRLFGNDPDVYLLRDEKIKLTKEQRYSLMMINALFGNVLMTSDDIGTYDEEKKQLLAKALHLNKGAKNVSFESRGKIIHVAYELDNLKHEFDYNIKKGTIQNER